MKGRECWEVVLDKKSTWHSYLCLSQLPAAGAGMCVLLGPHPCPSQRWCWGSPFPPLLDRSRGFTSTEIPRPHLPQRKTNSPCRFILPPFVCKADWLSCRQQDSYFPRLFKLPLHQVPHPQHCWRLGPHTSLCMHVGEGRGRPVYPRVFGSNCDLPSS